MDRINWSEFLPYFGNQWMQGEHVTCIASTGRGKSTLVEAILPYRRYVVVMAAKPEDPIIGQFRREGYFITRVWPPPEPVDSFPKVVFWPPIEKIEYVKSQAEAFRYAMLDLYERGRYCVVWDDGRYMSQTLGLRPLGEMYWMNGRSIKLSFVVNTQRPRWIPVEAYDAATHLFLWPDNDDANVARMAEMVGAPKKWLRETFLGMDKHDFLYVNTRENEAVISRVDIASRRKVAVA